MAKILKLLLVLLCILPLAAQSQTASLVMDLGRTGGVENSSYPGSFLSLRGKALFLADEESSGRKLWVSDGTAAGTELLSESCSEGCATPEILGSSGGGVFWIGQATPRSLLWWSDGTRAGTRALRKEELHAPSPDNGGAFTFAGEILYFEGCLDGQSCGVWRSDGTEEGTRPIVSTPPWENGSLSGFQAVGSTVFFLAEGKNGSFDFGLWRTDGTEAGTRLVKSLEIYPRLAAAAGDRFFFVASTRDGEGEELWTSDGTEAGTRVLVTFPEDPSEPPGGIPWLKPIGGHIYFIANDVLHGWEVWRSDGTPAGTERVTSFGVHDPFQGNLEPWQLEETGSRVVFFATDGIDDVHLWTATPGQPMAALAKVCLENVHGNCEFIDFDWRLGKVGGKVLFRGVDTAHGQQIWSTDGTASGTRRLSETCPGACGEVVSEPALSGSAAWFVAVDRKGAPRYELWRSDGTEAGTRRFVRLEADWWIGGPILAVVGSRVFFSAIDEYGSEPRVSDGTPEGTGLVKDIARQNPGAELQGLAALGNDLFFIACPEPFETSLYRSGGTPETTSAVFDSDAPEGCGALRQPVAAVGKVFFQNEGQLWATNGTPGNSARITQLDEESNQFLISAFAEHQGRLYFPISDQGTVELWRSDGTPGGTAKVLEIAEIRLIYRMASLGSELYFTALDRSGNLSPWRSDGTPAGTRRLTETDISDNDDNKDPQFIRLGGTVYFAGDELWRTNGTAQGTMVVSSLSSSLQDPKITDLTAFGGALYFFAGASSGGRALWRSDGTPAGTVVVKSFKEDDFQNPGSGRLTVFQGRLFFAADDGVHGRELWTSDGTTAGTTLVRDIYPGSQRSRPSDLVAAGGKLYFAADDGLNGRELWESDGTAAGTRLRQDLSPGGPLSSPQDFTVTGSHLFFSADDGVTGRELWALPLQESGGCQPSSTVLCLVGGRFRVEAFWRDFEGRTGAGRAAGLTADTGYFWFFDPENVEVVVKVLDGRGVNGHHWVFYGALSSVEYSITVTDTVTGVSRRYFNPTGRLGSVGHTEAFGPRGAFSRLAAGAEAPPVTAEGSAKAGPCVESATRLCLNHGRFAVEAVWKDFSGNTGTGKAVRLTGDTGYFWFFDDDNVELVLKVLDGRPVNNKFWVFYGALSSVEYTITVTDTATGQTKTYQNPSGRLASVADTAAF